MGDDPQTWRISRRSFLTTAGVVATAAAVPACVDRHDHEHVPDGAAAEPRHGTNVPEAELGGPRVGRFLDPEQAAVVMAVAARVIPGDADDPGAVEAGAVEYIDRLLATHDGYPDRTYTAGPQAGTYEGDQPPPAEDGVVWVHADEVDRYGWQLVMPPRDIYRAGLTRLQVLSEQRHGQGFAELSDQQQDELLMALEDAEDDDVTEVFDDVPSDTFFNVIRTHAIEGFLSDPVYGGNRGLVGWRHVGFPGSQRGYSPEELLSTDAPREPQGIGRLPMMHATHREDDAHALGAIRRRHPNGPID